MSSKKRPLPAKRQAAGCPGWMMTFGDCMSLLVTFFVMLIAFSSMEEAKLAAMVGVLRGAFGAVELTHAMGAVEREAIGDIERSSPAEVEHSSRGDAGEARFLTPEEISDALPDFINEIRPHGEEILSDRVLIQMLDEGLSIVLQTTDLFREGSVDWKEDFQSLWQGINWLLLGRSNEIRITSVTSGTAPVQRGIAATSWGLGIARAESIAKKLQDALSSPPNRFGIGVQIYDGGTDPSLADHVEILIMEKPVTVDVGTDVAWPKEAWQ